MTNEREESVLKIPLTLRRLQAISKLRSDRWHSGDMHTWTLNDWLVALGGEVGEAMNAAKKLKRIHDHLQQVNDTGRLVSDVQKAEEIIAEELADVQAYLVLCAEAINCDLETATIKKFNAVSEKYGFPERI